MAHPRPERTNTSAERRVAHARRKTAQHRSEMANGVVKSIRLGSKSEFRSHYKYNVAYFRSESVHSSLKRAA